MLPVLLALIFAIGLQLAIPARITVVPRWPLLTLELLLLVVLVTLNPLVLARSTRFGTQITRILLAAITIDNTLTAIRLCYDILTGQDSNNAPVLLGTGAAVFVTNIMVFGIWFWELDSGGPFARRDGTHTAPDFMFPQMGNPELAAPNWRPMFIDYLYVAFTNVLAFSPTDTMPMARWAKVMMALQSMVGLSTLVLVVSRAVGVLS